MCILVFLFFFFFKQKTAYEMRISDWSSDVCSSDLVHWQLLRNDSEGSLAAATHDASGHLILASQSGELLRFAPGRLQIEPTEPRVPASTHLGLPGGAMLSGGASGLHRLMPQPPVMPHDNQNWLRTPENRRGREE